MNADHARIAAEQEIVKTVIQSALLAGYHLGVEDSGAYPDGWVYRGHDGEACYKAMFAGDEDRLYIMLPNSESYIGTVHFVYGNDGWDVISGWSWRPQHVQVGATTRVTIPSTSPQMEAILKDAEALADKWEEKINAA